MKRILVGALFLLLLPVFSWAQTARYYISDVLPPVNPATCTNPDVECKTFYRVAIYDASPRPSFVAVIPTFRDTGVPAFSWAIVFTRGTDYTAVDADARNFRLFQGAEDNPAPTSVEQILANLDRDDWSLLTGAQKTAIKLKLDQIGVPTTDITGAFNLRTLLQRVGRRLNPSYNEALEYVR